MLQKDRVQQVDMASRQGYDAIFNAQFLEDIPEAIEQWQSSRVLLVASKSLAAQTDRVSSLQSILGSRLIDTKLGVGSHSPYADVRDIAHRIQKLRVDCVVCVGSSSYSDASKIGCLLAANLPLDFSIEDMEDLVDKDRGIADEINGKPLGPRNCRLIVVPTSLSASEWNSVSSATNRQGKKQHFGLWTIGQPDLILMDPELASTSPETLWLSSGMRCVDHCVELMSNPLSGEPGYEGVNVYCEKGLRCMIEGLTEYKKTKEAKVSGEEARQRMLQGISESQYGSRDAFSGLIIWRVPMGPSHAIGHQLGSVAHVMHGITSCVMLAPVLRWQAVNLPNPHYKRAQDKILEIFNETLGWRETSAADAIERFVKSLGLPSTLREVGVTSDEQVQQIADKTMTDVWGGGKRQMELEGILEIVNSARG